MTVGLFGYYQYGNFGDDLMAVMIGQYLIRNGYEVLFYGLPKQTANKIGAKSTTDFDDFCNNINLCVLGGGAFLKNFSAYNASDNQKDLENIFFNISERIYTKNIPSLFLSIGGDTDSHIRNIRSGVWSYITNRNCIGGTVRLKEDVQFLEKAIPHLKNKIEYHPDIVLSINKIFREKNIKKRNKDNIPSIGINIQSKHVINPITYYSKYFKKFNITFVHNSHSDQKSFIKNYPHSKKSNHYSTDCPFKMLKQIDTIDAFIGFRLHLGIVCFMKGLNYLTINPKSKTKLALSQMGLEDYCYRIKINDLPWLIKNLNKLDTIYYKIDNRINKHIEESYKHYLFIDKIIEKLK